MLDVSVEIKSVDAFLDAFPREMAKAIRSASVRSSKAMGTQANRVVAKDMGIKVGTARSRIKAFGPTSDLTWGVRASSKRIPLIEFGASGPEPSRGKGSGVTYRKGSGRGKGRVPHGFIVSVGAGHRGVFKRKPGAGRLPIQELFGPSVGRVLSEQQKSVKTRGHDVFERELDRLMDRIVGGGASALPSFGGRLAA